MMSCYSPLLNTFNIGKILQSVELLCKHEHNNWESSELVVELWFHKSQSWEASLILHVAYYLYHGQLANLTYSRKLENNIWDVVTRCHILVNGLVSKRGTMQAAAFNLIVNLNMPCWQLRSLTFRSSCSWTSFSSTLRIVLPKQKNYFKNLKVIGKRCIKV